MGKINLIYLAPVYDGSGYSETARNLLIGLINSGSYNIQLSNYLTSNIINNNISHEVMATFRSLEGNKVDARSAVSVQLCLPSSWRRISKFNIGYGMFETDRIPKSWVPNCNLMDAIVVPCMTTKIAFEVRGVRCPVVVVPNGVDLFYYNPTVKPFSMFSEKFNFLSVGTVQHRKGWDAVVYSFLDTFRDKSDARLIVKPYCDNPTDEVQMKQLVKTLRDHLDSHKAEILMINRYLSDHQMARLYRSANAFVFPTRGESWGYSPSQAAACGTPVITTGWSAPAEYLAPDASYHISYTLVKPQGMNHPSYIAADNDGDHLWAEPRREHLSELMLLNYTNTIDPLMRATKSAIAMRKLSWSRASEVFDMEIKKVVLSK